MLKRFVLFLFILLSAVSASSSAAASHVSSLVRDALSAIAAGEIGSGVRMMLDALAVNDIHAQFYMAVCYEQGIVVEKNDSAAFMLYRKAAERGLPDAMCRLASFYADGTVVAASISRRDEWLRRFERKGGTMTLRPLEDVYASAGSSGAESHEYHPVAQDLPLAASGKSVDDVRRSKSVSTVASAAEATVPPVAVSDVDCGIPVSGSVNPTTFVLVIANENYQQAVDVPYALNDGDLFSEYCRLTLGIPQTNIHIVRNATLNNIRRELGLFRQISEAYAGGVSLLVYYAGHGIPDTSGGSAYLMPVDGYASDLSTCYSLDGLIAMLGSIPSEKTVLFVDACFSGAQRGDGMVYAARGVAIKPKKSAVSGRMVVISAASDEQTAHPYDEKHHGMFTYFLLDALKGAEGDVTLGALYDSLRTNVSRCALVTKGRPQTPSVSCSPLVRDDWSGWKLTE